MSNNQWLKERRTLISMSQASLDELEVYLKT